MRDLAAKLGALPHTRAEDEFSAGGLKTRIDWYWLDRRRLGEPPRLVVVEAQHAIEYFGALCPRQTYQRDVLILAEGRRLLMTITTICEEGFFSLLDPEATSVVRQRRLACGGGFFNVGSRIPLIPVAHRLPGGGDYLVQVGDRDRRLFEWRLPGSFLR